jgi:hypothetical protein
MLSNFDLQDERPETKRLDHCVALKVLFMYPIILL